MKTTFMPTAFFLYFSPTGKDFKTGFPMQRRCWPKSCTIQRKCFSIYCTNGDVPAGTGACADMVMRTCRKPQTDPNASDYRTGDPVTGW